MTVGQTDLPPARAVLHHRHAEPDRAGRHLSAARGPAGPLHVQHQGRLSVGRGRGADPGQTTRGEKVEVRKVLSGKAILNLQGLVGQGGGERVHRAVRVAGWCAPTRPKDASAPKFVQDLVDWGAGPRAGQFLIQGGKALAAMDGRFSVAIEDVQKVAVPVLRHRISTNFQAQAEGMSNEDIIERLVRETPPPVIPKYEK